MCFYHKALIYDRTEYGNLDVLARYETPAGICLGSFITNLRITWAKVDCKWEANYLACAEYDMEQRNPNIPASYVSRDGLKIGAWMQSAWSGKQNEDFLQRRMY